jgi:hypothetical protein
MTMNRISKTLLIAAAVMASGAAQAQTRYVLRSKIVPKIATAPTAAKPGTTCGALVQEYWCTAQIPNMPAAAIVKQSSSTMNTTDAAAWCNANKPADMIGVCMMQTNQPVMIVSGCSTGYVGQGTYYNASNCR